MKKKKPIAPKKRQFELSTFDFDFLSKAQFSATAWVVIAKRHGVDPASVEQLPNTNNRGYLGFPKVYPREAPVYNSAVSGPGIVTREELSAMRSNHSPTLTQPMTNETTIEVIEVKK